MPTGRAASPRTASRSCGDSPSASRGPGRGRGTRSPVHTATRSRGRAIPPAADGCVTRRGWSASPTADRPALLALAALATGRHTLFRHLRELLEQHGPRVDVDGPAFPVRLPRRARRLRRGPPCPAPPARAVHRRSLRWHGAPCPATCSTVTLVRSLGRAADAYRGRR